MKWALPTLPALPNLPNFLRGWKIELPASPVSTVGSIPSQTWTQGDLVDIDLSVYFANATSYSVQSGTLPDFVLLDPNTGILSGTMEEDQFSQLTITVRGHNSVSHADQTFTVDWQAAASYAAPQVAGEFVGFLPERSEGTAGDWFVAPNGDDSNAGTIGAPFKTIGKAMSEASGGDVIRLRAGTYRETIDFTGKGGSLGSRTTVARYGTEEAIISGFEVLSGWTACGADDEAVVGPNYAEIYKVTVATSALPNSTGRAANLYEGQVKLNLAALKVPFPFRPYSDLYTGDWLSADSIGKDGSGNITSYTMAGLSERFTEAQIENAVIGYYVYPNQNAESGIAGFDDSTDTITLSDVGYKQEGDSKRFCLINLLPAMKPGQWGYVTDGSDTTLYLWPLDAGHLSGGIFHSARSRAVKMPEAYCEIRGLILEGTATTGYGGLAIASVEVTGQHTAVENCLSRNAFTATGVGTVLICWGANSVIRNFGIENAPGCKGIWGGSAGMVIDRCLIRRSGREALRFYGGNDAMITRNLCIDCGDGAHSNKGNVYFGGYNYLWWHNIWHGCAGYFTWQEASSIHLGFNWVPTGNDRRAIVDQNRDGGYSYATTNEQYETAYIVNNITPPQPTGSAQNSITVGRDYEPYALYALHNNVVVSIGARAENLDGWSNNLYQSESKRDPSDTLITEGDVWENIAIGDIAVKADSPSRTALAADLSSILTTLQTTLGFDYDGFGVDLAGQPFAPDAPPVGPYLPGSTPVALPPVWVRPPVVSGAPEPGHTLTVSSGELVGYPYPAKTYQWIRSDDEFITHSNITGETTDSYEVDEADIGYKIGCIVTAGGEAVTTPVANSVVTEAYPISAPEVLATINRPFATPDGTLKHETVPFVSDGTAIVVVVGASYNNDSTSYTITVGAEGRAFGTGTVVGYIGMATQSQSLSALHFLANPPVGEVTVQVEAVNKHPSWDIAVIRMAGAVEASHRKREAAAPNNTVTVTTSTLEDEGYALFLSGSGGGLKVDAGGDVIYQASTVLVFGHAVPSASSVTGTVSTVSGNPNHFALSMFEVRSIPHV